MKVRINGEDREIDPGSTIDAVLESLNIKRAGIAVELNLEIVPKSLYPETLLEEGDRVEIVRMVGGG